MSSSTDNLDLTKLAQGENFSNAILNQNWEKVDEFAGIVNPKKTTTITSITSDAYILGLENGNYKVALSSASEYLPEQWGTLEVSKTGASGSAPYGTATFVSTSGKQYIRSMRNTNEWVTSWQQLALNSQITTIDNKIGYSAFFSDSINASTTKTYTLSSSHRGIIFIIGAGGARCILIIRNGGLTHIGDYNSLTISFTDDTTLSITNSTATVLYMYANMYSGTIA